MRDMVHNVEQREMFLLNRQILRFSTGIKANRETAEHMVCLQPFIRLLTMANLTPDLVEKSFRLRKESKNIEDLSHKNVSFILKIKFYGKNKKNWVPTKQICLNFTFKHLLAEFGKNGRSGQNLTTFITSQVWTPPLDPLLI